MVDIFKPNQLVTGRPTNKQQRPCEISPNTSSACNKSPKQLKSQTVRDAFQLKSSCIQTLQMWLLPMHISSIHQRPDINAGIHLQPYSLCPSVGVYCHWHVQWLRLLPLRLSEFYVYFFIFAKFDSKNLPCGRNWTELWKIKIKHFNLIELICKKEQFDSLVSTLSCWVS